jgi:hypothetical protein
MTRTEIPAFTLHLTRAQGSHLQAEDAPGATMLCGLKVRASSVVGIVNHSAGSCQDCRRAAFELEQAAQ